MVCYGILIAILSILAWNYEWFDIGNYPSERDFLVFHDSQVIKNDVKNAAKNFLKEDVEVDSQE